MFTAFVVFTWQSVHRVLVFTLFTARGEGHKSLMFILCSQCRGSQQCSQCSVFTVFTRCTCLRDQGNAFTGHWQVHNVRVFTMCSHVHKVHSALCSQCSQGTSVLTCVHRVEGHSVHTVHSVVCSQCPQGARVHEIRGTTNNRPLFCCCCRRNGPAAGALHVKPEHSVSPKRTEPPATDLLNSCVLFLSKTSQMPFKATCPVSAPPVAGSSANFS